MIRQQLVLKQSGLWMYTYIDGKLTKLKRVYPGRNCVLQKLGDK